MNHYGTAVTSTPVIPLTVNALYRCPDCDAYRIITGVYTAHANKLTPVCDLHDELATMVYVSSGVHIWKPNEICIQGNP
jgi:hypothetical protein